MGQVGFLLKIEMQQPMGAASSLYLSVFSPFASIVNILDCVSCGDVKMGYYITARYL